jgi:hypothetical protein
VRQHSTALTAPASAISAAIPRSPTCQLGGNLSRKEAFPGLPHGDMPRRRVLYCRPPCPWHEAKTVTRFRAPFGHNVLGARRLLRVRSPRAASGISGSAMRLRADCNLISGRELKTAFMAPETVFLLRRCRLRRMGKCCLWRLRLRLGFNSRRLERRSASNSARFRRAVSTHRKLRRTLRSQRMSTAYHPPALSDMPARD